MFNVESTLLSLAAQRPLFHSEADFQHAFAWRIHEIASTAKVRLEYKPFPDERIFADLWIVEQDGITAIELKYLTGACDAFVGGERFAIRHQGAVDLGRYDILKDLVRMERVVEHFPGSRGFVIALTNEPAYWRPALRTTTVDAAFRIHDGQTVAGALSWAAHTGGTMRGRERSLEIRGTYMIQWKDYSAVPDVRLGTFKYLLLPALPDTRTALSSDHGWGAAD